MEYEIKPKSKLTLGISELWQYRELFYFFTWRDIKVKYKQTILGFAWAVLQPIVMMVLFTVFFADRLYDGSQVVPYPVFVYSGLLLWNIFSSGLANAGNSMVTNANIIKKIYFPRLIIPLSAVLVSLFDFLMSLLVFIGVLLYYKVSVSLIGVFIYLPLSVFITILSTFGIGTFLSALNIKYRDFRYLIPFMIQALLFATPIIYPITNISNYWFKMVLSLNPMCAAVNLFRNIFSESVIDVNLLLISLISSIFFLFMGLYYFRKTESYFADLA